MKNFIISNLPTIIIMAALLIYVVYLIINRKWEKLRLFAYMLILEAEKSLKGNKKGQERFNLVIDKLYAFIPKWLQFFLTEEFMRKKLQEWFIDIKDYLDNGKIDNSIQDAADTDLQTL